MQMNGVFIIPDITIWTGKATLNRDELPVAADQLPPDDVTKSFGNKAIYDKAKLRPFLAIKSRMRTLLQAKCLPFMGGYMCGDDYLADVEQGLTALRDEFHAEVGKLENEYEAACEDWLAAHKEWAHILRPAMPDAHSIGRRFYFGWSVVRIEPVGADTEQECGSIVDKAIESIVEDICEARDTYLKPASRNSAKPLDGLIARCNALAFTGSPQLGKLAAVFEAMKGISKRELIGMTLGAFATPSGLQGALNSLPDSPDATDIWQQLNDIMGVGISEPDTPEQEVMEDIQDIPDETPVAMPEPVMPVQEQVPAMQIIKSVPDDEPVFLDSFGLF